MDFHNFDIVFVFKVKESIADISVSSYTSDFVIGLMH